MSSCARRPAVLAGLTCPVVLLSLFLAAAPACAQDEEPSKAPPMWAELTIGGGTLRRNVFGSTDNPGHASIAATFGTLLNQHLLVGVQGGVQLALGGPDEAPGSVNLSVLAVAKIYPSKMSGLHLRLGGGVLVMRDEIYTCECEENALLGAAWEAGLGYDFRLRKGGSLGPFVTYRRSFASGLRETSVTVGLAWTDR